MSDTTISIKLDAPGLKRERNRQYFRYQDDRMEEQAWLLLEKEGLTEQDILEFCNNNNDNTVVNNNENAIQLAYRSRRLEIHDLVHKLQNGQARIDDYGRLRPVDNNNNANHNNNPPAAEHDLPLLPPLAQNIPPVFPPLEGNHNNNDPVRRQAEAAIARAVERYRQQGVSMDSLELIHLPIPERLDPVPLTFRRILIAVIAVVLAFLFMLLQTLGRPNGSSNGGASSVIPNYAETLLLGRDFLEHVAECGMDRNGTNKKQEWWWNAHHSSCGRGVLMVPSPETIIRKFAKAMSVEEIKLWEPFFVPESGVNVSWWMPCEPVQQENQQCQETCFRGIHDALVSTSEVDQAISLGASLIEEGGDHFDIHTNVELLQRSLPTVVSKLRSLLQVQYNVPDPEVVAFRVHASAPLSGDGVLSSHLIKLLNRTRYRYWMEASAYQNRLAAHFPIPWPLTLFAPVRNTCNLLADQQANSSFDVHTSVFLADGRSSGLFLFADEIKDLVTRGLTVESSPGRIVVSTGGLENQRCRLPPHSGVSANLQVWWKMGS